MTNPMTNPMNQPRIPGNAIAALVLGIFSGVTACFPLGIVALILGINALSKINSRPAEFGGKGFALTGIITGICSLSIGPIALLIAILLPALGHERELANRITCGANITGALQAALTYAEENGGYLPMTDLPTAAGMAPAEASRLPAPAGRATAAYTLEWGASTGQTSADNALADIQNNAKGNAASCLWILCIQGTVSPKGLLCRSDPAASPTASPLQNAADEYYRSPTAGNQLSYSIASPWAIDPATGAAGNSGVWRNHTLASVPVMSDMAPKNGTPTGRADTRNLFVNPMTASATPKTLNSGNHAGQGQEVGFGDCHVEWCRKPNVGESGDNIWTTTNNMTTTPWGNAQPTAGTPITPFSTTDPFDVIMIPCRNLNDNTVH